MIALNNDMLNILTKLSKLNILNKFDIELTTTKCIEIDDLDLGEISDVDFDVRVINDKSIDTKMIYILRCKNDTEDKLIEIEIVGAGHLYHSDVKYIRLIQNLVYLYARFFISDNVKNITKALENVPKNLHNYEVGNKKYIPVDGPLAKIRRGIIDFSRYTLKFKLFN